MLDFIERHEVLMSIVVWPLLTAIVSGLFKPRTPEQYSALPPRLAAFLKLVGAVGFDVPNMLEAVKQGIAGKSKSPGVYRATRSSPLPAPERTTPTPVTRREPKVYANPDNYTIDLETNPDSVPDPFGPKGPR